MDTVYCRNCREAIDSADTFCKKCGSDQQVAPTKQPAYVTEPDAPQNPLPTSAPRKSAGIILSVILILAIVISTSVFAVSSYQRNEQARQKEEQVKKLVGEYLLVQDKWRKHKQSLDALESLWILGSLSRDDQMFKNVENRIESEEKRMEEIIEIVGAEKLRLMVQGVEP